MLKTSLYVEILQTPTAAIPRVGRASGNPISHGENTSCVFKFDLEIDDRFFKDKAVDTGMIIRLTDPELPASVIKKGLKDIDTEMKDLQ